MRISAASLIILVVALGYQQAPAEEPQVPPQSVAAAPAGEQTAALQRDAAAPSAEKSTPAPGAQQNAPPEAAANTLKPGVTVVGTKPELTPEDKELIARGYKLEMRNGEKYFCHREQQLGSRFETKYCDTAQSLQAHRLNSQEAVRVIQTNTPRVGN
jgi:hypothetical protein